MNTINPNLPDWMNDHVKAEPRRLPPLGPTDCHAFPNGVIIYWQDGKAFIHAGMNEAAIIVPMHLFAAIVSACTSVGLDAEQAALIAEAAEAERPRPHSNDPMDDVLHDLAAPQPVTHFLVDLETVPGKVVLNLMIRDGAYRSGNVYISHDFEITGLTEAMAQQLLLAAHKVKP